MGLLSCGKPLSWDETKLLAKHVQQHGIQQFIHMYQKHRDRKGDALKWGDEVEYILLKMDDERKTAKVALRAEQLLEILNEREFADPKGVKSLWRPEHAAYMIEGTPGQPYEGLLAHLGAVEANMRLRRLEVLELLKPDETVLSITNFPRLGTPSYTWPDYLPNPKTGCTRSVYIPDEAIFPGHPRYKTIARNIPTRRGEKVDINLTVFKDEYTKLPVEGSPADQPDAVHMDAISFGCGCCCLQVTIQACDLPEARTLYDQLTPLCPIMLALSAASPAFRGYLTESDCRWKAISESCDCRTDEERGKTPLNKDQFRIRKSRYDTTDSYLSPGGEQYNDLPLEYDETNYRTLRDAGVDHLMAQHVAHLFVRDPISLFHEKVHQNDQEESDHFDNIQSTNWQSMRFKPPPHNSDIGWRVEFRPCEVQLTDFENAAYAVFIVLVTRVILSYKLNLLVPISKVDENMQRAQERDACLRHRFWFRKDIIGKSSAPTPLTNGRNTAAAAAAAENGYSEKPDSEYELMSIDQIMNGNHEFPGLIPLVYNYLDSMEVDADTYIKIRQYIDLIQGRASGKLQTTAAWIRKEVLAHPEYKKDSVVSERINYDLLKQMQAIQTGELQTAALLGTISSRSQTRETVPLAISRSSYPTSNKVRARYDMESISAKIQRQ